MAPSAFQGIVFSKVCEGLDQLYRDQQLCDLTVTVGDKTFHCHRLVLVAVSQFFQSSLTSSWRESSSGEVSIEHEDVPAESFSLLLDILYDGKEVITVETAENVLKTSIFLRIKFLEDYRLDFLADSLTPDNCLRIWQLAEMYELTALSEIAFSTAVNGYEKLSKCEELVYLPKALLLMVLSSQPEGEHICREVFRWTQADIKNRKHHLGELLPFVNFLDLSQEYLTTLMGYLDRPFRDEVFEYITNAVAYKLNPDNRVFRRILQAQQGAGRVQLVNFSPHDTNASTESLSHTTPPPKNDISEETGGLPFGTAAPAASGLFGAAAPAAGGGFRFGTAASATSGLPAFGTVAPAAKPSSSLLSRFAAQPVKSVGSFTPRTQAESVFKSVTPKTADYGLTKCVMLITVSQAESAPCGVLRFMFLPFEVHPSGVFKMYTLQSLPEVFGVNFATCVLHNQVYISGGSENHTYYMRYATARNGWDVLPAMPEGRKKHAMAAVSRVVYVMGGLQSGCPVQHVPAADIFAFDTRTSKWRVFSRLVLPVAEPATAVLGHRVYVFGGQTDGDQETDVVQCVNTITGVVYRAGRLPCPTSGARAVSDGGTIYLATGRGQCAQDEGELRAG